ncbi:MAG: glycoside hydrolase family 97 protein [Thermotoga sp.]|nr:MAG: glycoside hydrolase family 97 protein [Thermotoga sp.]
MSKRFNLMLGVMLLLWMTVGGFASNVSEGVNSPNGKVRIDFILKNGSPYYNVFYENKPIIQDSSLGFHLKDGKPLCKGFKILDTIRNSVNEAWKPIWGERDVIKDHYNQLIVKLEEVKPPYRQMNLVFRAYNEGIAFRYVLPRQKNLDDFIITSEDTQFRFAGNYTAWWQPGNYDSVYEESYNVTPLEKILLKVNMPVTIKVNEHLYVCLTEAALTDYADALLSPISSKEHLFKIDLVPWPDGVIKVIASTPHSTPWRVMIIGNRAGALIEQDYLILNLNEPCVLKDTSWIKPGKLTGVWWGYHTRRYGPWAATTERVKKFIDFASRHGIHKLIVEGWTAEGWSCWSNQNFTTPSEYLDLREIMNYGKKHGVRFLMWMETGGNYESLIRQFDKAIELYEKWGAFGIMVGWAGSTKPHNHHDQFMVNLYHKIVKKAAAHHLTVIFHEAYKPTGLRRTYPNWVSREAVQGMEYSAWSWENTAKHMVILPFVRNVAGPMNYTPGVFDPAIKGNIHRVESTVARQLAMYVVYFDPQQRVVGFPENCEAAPSFEFIDHVPTTWDDTKVLNGKIGDYITIARREGNEWYVGSMTDKNARVLEIPLSFLDAGQYVAHIYTDSIDAHYLKNPKPVDINRFIVDSHDVIIASLAPGGGQAIRLVPATAEDIKKCPVYKQPICEISNLSVPDKVKAGELFTVGAEIKNMGSMVSGREINLYVDGKLIDSKVVRLASEEKKRVSFIIRLYRHGSHEITICDSQAKGVAVKARPATFEYNKLILYPVGNIGDNLIDVIIDIKNTGSYKGNELVKLYVNGKTVDSKEITLEPGTSKRLIFHYKIEKKGIYEFKVGNLSRKINWRW